MTLARTLFPLATGLLATLAVGIGGCAACRAGSRSERELDRLAGLLELRTGSVVADIGAGSGDFSLALARRVGPTGRVYATEIEASKRAKIERKARDAGLSNVTVLEALEDGTGLPDGCCDGAFLRGVYHHLTRPEAIVASLHRALRPGARLVVIDFRPTRWLALWTPKGVPANRGGHGVRPEIVTAEALAGGFERLSLDDDWPASWLIHHYALTFRRP
jgi:ubiquinone/menaquinone biosynthesis C-methylase UbiE